MEDSQSSAGNPSQSQPQSSINRVTTPPPLTPCRRPTPSKRISNSPKIDATEGKLLQIIGKPELKPDDDEMFCRLNDFLKNRT